MVIGYDGTELISELEPYLTPGSTILELGIGPGKDLDIFRKTYKITGSDNSKIFVDRYKKINPNVDVFHLDAITIQFDKKFDCIYSNKVLMHLSKQELKASLKRQKEVLNTEGYYSIRFGMEARKKLIMA